MTEYNADAVAFCPDADVLACGCYQLSESGATIADGTRLGCIELYSTRLDGATKARSTALKSSDVVVQF